MLGVLYYAGVVFLALIILYLVAVLIFSAYFTARTQFINNMLSKAKELSSNGKE